jgi:hypothetical protein
MRACGTTGGTRATATRGRVWRSRRALRPMIETPVRARTPRTHKRQGHAASAAARAGRARVQRRHRVPKASGGSSARDLRGPGADRALARLSRDVSAAVPHGAGAAVVGARSFTAFPTHAGHAPARRCASSTTRSVGVRRASGLRHRAVTGCDILPPRLHHWPLLASKRVAGATEGRFTATCARRNGFSYATARSASARVCAERES